MREEGKARVSSGTSSPCALGWAWPRGWDQDGGNGRVIVKQTHLTGGLQAVDQFLGELHGRVGREDMFR
jgi:hypothetical protein